MPQKEALAGETASAREATGATPHANTPAPAGQRRAGDDRESWAGLVAVHYLALRLQPVPADPASKHPLVEWGRFNNGDRVTPADLERWRPVFLRAGGVGAVCGHGHAVADLDREHSHFDQAAAFFDALGGPAVMTPSGGFHFGFRTDQETATRRVAGVEIKARGGFVMLPPTPGYRWQRFPNAPLADWPRLPDLATAPWATTTRAELVAAGADDDLAGYLALLPDLRMNGATGRAPCPFHRDEKPSFTLARRGGRWRWRCWADDCPGSARSYRGKIYHCGDLTDLRRLLRRQERHQRGDAARRHASAWDDYLRGIEAATDLPTDVIETLRAVAKVGRDRDLDPTRPMDVSYRVLRAHLGGRHRLLEVRERMLALERCAAADVEIGLPRKHPSGPRTTQIALRAGTYVPWCRGIRSGSRG